MLGVSADDKHCVTVDGKVVVGRRLHHRAGVHRPHPQGQRSSHLSVASVGGARPAAMPLRAAAAWPLVPRSRTLSSGRRLGPSDLSDPYVMKMCHILRIQRAPPHRREIQVDQRDKRTTAHYPLGCTVEVPYFASDLSFEGDNGLPLILTDVYYIQVHESP